MGTGTGLSLGCKAVALTELHSHLFQSCNMARSVRSALCALVERRSPADEVIPMDSGGCWKGPENEHYRAPPLA